MEVFQKLAGGIGRRWDLLSASYGLVQLDSFGILERPEQVRREEKSAKTLQDYGAALQDG